MSATARRPGSDQTERRVDRTGPLSRSRRKLIGVMIGVALVGAAVALPGVWVRATYGAQTSADEPHYLLTAISLAEDQDLNLADEFTEERYRPFHEIRLTPQGAEVGDERIVSPHDPLLPALLAVPWRLGGWQGAKIALTLVNGAIGALLVWTAVRRFGARVGTAGLIAGLFVAAAPLAPYGTQVYPELPAAFAVLAAVAAATGPARVRSAAVVVTAIVALPWLAIKYAPVALALTAYALVRWWRGGARRMAIGAAGALAVAAVAYLIAHLAWYGGVTSYAVSDFFRERGGEFSAVGTSPDAWGRSRRLIGLLVGDQFGLASWQPAWLLTIPAVAALARRRPAGWLAVALPLGAGWLTATFVALTMQGWWFPGRQVVVVLPLAVLTVVWLAERGAVWWWSTVVSGALGVFIWAWLLVEGLQEQLTLIVDFASTSNPIHRAWQVVLPNYLDVTTTTWVLHGTWIAIAVLLAIAGWRSTKADSGRRVSLGGAP